ncbi:uncharacterized protein LOC112345788 isoform X2 [Selaginella moellendorffii]|uniref:uncharacterized protein LOC112345788 isoform X2 n=1 Tax=Selaginella moellendorffii TaxID=88036 RepID=UPI000D1CB814|nr:uncharacterized protein LOC112345788 isoform X2 [Selaginella moellendorffii]|eukprot:XP_024528978.1 uncharacterized protein LOC112345788 isoform X2 [Selaginella moellendorffii]
MPLVWVPVGGKSAIAARNRPPAAIAAAAAVPGSPRDRKWKFLEDLSAPVPSFLENLKLVCAAGTGKKFHVIRRELTKALENSPAPGPCTFIARCIDALLRLEDPSDQTLGHLITRSLDELDESFKSDSQDISCSKRVAAKLVKSAMSGDLTLDERLLVRLVTTFGVELSDLAEADQDEEHDCSCMDEKKESSISEARKLGENLVLKLVKGRSYNSAVALLKSFGLEECTGREFLVTMVRDNQVDLAGQWAWHLGPESCRFLVQHCTDRKLFKMAYRLVDRYGMHDEFPEAYHLYKRSSLRKLVSKGLWVFAESIASSDRVLQEYLISLALGRKQHNRAAQFCELFHLDDLDLSSITIEILEEDQVGDYIQLESIVDLDRVVWVDDAEGTKLVTKHLIEAEAIGIDCEWKPVSTKGEQAKVSILQMASKEDAFVLDLLGLSVTAPQALNLCISTLFQSEEIIKLGYAVHNDLEMLAESFPEVDGFRSCKTIIDLQVFPDKLSAGGLSGLTKLTMGGHLDKDVRMTDWNQRPLCKEQLHYAALDAAILPLIHESLCSSHCLKDQGRSRAKSWKYRFKAMVDSSRAAVDQVKNELQELALAAGLPRPIYNTVFSGPDHSRKFSSTVTVAGRIIQGSPASKKKESEVLAAKVAIALIHEGILTTDESVVTSQIENSNGCD